MHENVCKSFKTSIITVIFCFNINIAWYIMPYCHNCILCYLNAYLLMFTSKSCLSQLYVGVVLLDPGVFYQIDAGALMDGEEVSVTNVCWSIQELHE